MAIQDEQNVSGGRVTDENTQPAEQHSANEQAREEARQRMISRRRMVLAGMAAVPVLLTLRAVPARATTNTLTASACRCVYNNAKDSSKGMTGNTYTQSNHCKKAPR
jgi:hypothetical protein